MLATAPTTGDFGLTWDEPAYRYSQLVSEQWWKQLASARSLKEVSAQLDPDALLYYWQYARHGINFHPPLAGQLNLLSYALLGNWWKDVPARRMASVVEFALAITLLVTFLGARYGRFCGIVAGSALLCMPRLYGDAHIAGTDTPGLLLWPAAALTAWKGLTEPTARESRIAFGILVGLGFLTKMASVVVLVPVVLWIMATRFPHFLRHGRKSDWLDGLLTLGALCAPLLVAFAEIKRLTRLLPEPRFTDLFRDRPASLLPGVILATPLALWLIRRAFGRLFPQSPLWGTTRPALELLASLLAFGPVVGWLGNPAWWRETFPRLAHYYLLNTNRAGSLPDIRIYYWGETYLYSLPWHNAWVLLAITVPVSLLIPAFIGLLRGVVMSPKDRLPIYLGIQLITLPVFRMLNTPAHDGVRLYLPTFFFLAAFAGLGAGWASSLSTRNLRSPRAPRFVYPLLYLAVIGPAAIALIRIHPYELSYYNEVVGGPAGAWRKGFEISYWYDAFNPVFLSELNRELPPGAAITPPNTYSEVPTFSELQTLGMLRSDLRIGDTRADQFPHKWLLTHDSKADGYSKLLFTLRPRYALKPPPFKGLPIASVADPSQAALAWALELLADRKPGGKPRISQGQAPDWISRVFPPAARLWGDGIVRPPAPRPNEEILRWARTDGPGLIRAAEILASSTDPQTAAEKDPEAFRLLRAIDSSFGRDSLLYLLQFNPSALPLAARLLAEQPDAFRAILTKPGYSDPSILRLDQMTQVGH